MSKNDHDHAEAAEQGRVAELKSSAADALGSARETVSGALGSAKEKVGHAFEAASSKASSAYSATRERAGSARETASGRVDENPALALLGGLALGVVLGALIPRSDREKAALEGVGERIRTAASDAARAAREAGQGKLDEFGLNKGAATEQVKTLVDHAIAAAGTAGQAAVQAVKSGPAQG